MRITYLHHMEKEVNEDHLFTAYGYPIGCLHKVLNSCKLHHFFSKTLWPEEMKAHSSHDT